jgi:HPt (histidine-containing phosphotransfer) domain-containing protein
LDAGGHGAEAARETAAEAARETAAEAARETTAEDTADKSESPEYIDGDDGGNGAIDPSALKDVFGDDNETFKEILNGFLEPAESDVGEIEAAFADRSADGVAKAAHKLKSSSRSVGANELADLCLTLEEAGNAENWDEIDNAAPRLAGVMQKVTEYIKAL